MHVVNAQVLEQWNALSDEDIVSQVLAGQTALFEVLMRRHNERVYRAARSVVRNEDEELLNVETFMSKRPPGDPERQAFSGEIRGLLEWAIDGLPDGAREVFILREVEGLTTAETAAVLDVSDDVVKTRLWRARAALRRVLEERIGESTPEAFRFYRPRCDRVVERVMSIIGTSKVTHPSD